MKQTPRPKKSPRSTIADPGKLETALKQITSSDLLCFVVAGFDGAVRSADETFRKTLGYAEDDLLPGLSEMTPREHHHLDQEAFEKIRAFGFCAPFEKEFVRKDGVSVPVLFGAAIIEGSQDEIVGFAVDLTHQKHSQQNLSHLAYHDALTDLPNQALFKDRLKQAMALRRRNDEMQAVLLLNLDRFKTINDSLGYNAGDAVLKAVAQRLSSCVREGDTVARFGSDEFAILLRQIDRHQDAEKVARNIKSALEQAFLFDEQELFVSSSIGISLYPYDGQDTPTLLRSAGAALQRVKEQGGNSYKFYAAGRTTKALKQLVLESNMRAGLERTEFIVEYQPQVNTLDFRIVGMEALLRWRHPGLGLLYPGEFIQLAENSGLIISIGDWVLETACFQNKYWHDAGFDPLRLSVNFSARQFQHPTFLSTVAHILKETQLDPSCLELELTEGSIMKDPEQAIEKLQELKSMGLRVAIDDFGTGYSSLNYLKRFPIDTLKIDQSFVRDLSSDAHDAAIVRAIITLAHALGLTVIAEGVETQEQLESLTLLECDVVQGFLFSKSLASEDFHELLMEQRRAKESGEDSIRIDYSTSRLPSLSTLKPAE